MVLYTCPLNFPLAIRYVADDTKKENTDWYYELKNKTIYSVSLLFFLCCLVEPEH